MCQSVAIGFCCNQKTFVGERCENRVVLGCLRGISFVATKLAYCYHFFGQMPRVFPLRHSPNATLIFHGYSSSATNTEPWGLTTVATALLPSRLLDRWNSPVYSPRPILWLETMTTNLILMGKNELAQTIQSWYHEFCGYRRGH